MNRLARLSTIAFVAATTFATQGWASSSAWHGVEGGRVRLVTSGLADASGIVRGALEIALKPGWKTYWRDPGDAGVPPTIDVQASTNVASAVIDYPAPHRFDDGYAVWAGYKEPVSLPVSFTASRTGDPTLIEADVFLGICETICIPVQARLSVDPASDPDNPEDLALVAAAIAALPGTAATGFGVSLVSADEKEMVVEANLPGDSVGAEFFLAASDGYYFGPPERRDANGKTLFAIPILERPSSRPSDGGLFYTLSATAGAVSGILGFP